MLTNTQPWMKTTSSELVEQIYAVSIESLRVCGLLLQPFIPQKAGELLDALGVSMEMRTWGHAQILGAAVGEVKKGVRLFSHHQKTTL